LRKISAVALVLLVLSGCQTSELNGQVAPAIYAPTSDFKDRCDPDPQTPKAWTNVANLAGCTNPFRIVSKSLTSARPVAKLSDLKDQLDVSKCKIEDAGGARDSKYIGFPTSTEKKQFFAERRFPSAKTVFQVVPISSIDAPAGSHTPNTDYDHYFAWIKDYLSYISDFGGDIEFRVPQKYIELSKPFAPFNVRHESRDFDTFSNFVISQVDKQIDFTGANVILFVEPLGTDPKVIGQQHFNPVSTQEGKIYNVGSTYPNDTVGTIYDAGPIWWLHELYHGGLDLGDGFGDEKFQDGPNRGMGEWGLMSTGKSEFLTWHKWLLGFNEDSQVACLDSSQETITWLVPSSYKSQKTKLAVIPLSENKAIVVESIRAAGLNFKVGAEGQGALAYVVDTKDRRPNFGFTVLRVEGKTGYQGNYHDPNMVNFNSQNVAPLYVGESVIYEGVKITNVEWGEFGDVIKVEPVK
jgi:hypothetical protein